MIMVGSTTMLMGMVLVSDLDRVDSYICLLLLPDDWNVLVLTTDLGSQNKVYIGNLVSCPLLHFSSI